MYGSVFLIFVLVSVGSRSGCAIDHAFLDGAARPREGRSMKVNILGFGWQLPALVTLNELFALLRQTEGREEDFAGHSRLVFVGETQRYHTGLLLTSKTNRRFCELQRRQRALQINVREVAEGSSLIDFNFFVMHKRTARGLYQYYHQSFHPNVFSRFCRGRCAQLQRQKVAQAIAARGPDLTDREREQIEERFGGTLDWSLLIRPENFQTIVRHLQRISEFHFNYETIEAEEERVFRGFRGVSQRLTHRVTFRRSATLAQRSRAILDFVQNANDLGDAAVVGIDQDGLQKTVNLFDNPDSFGSFEFDAVTDQIVPNPGEFANASFLRELIRIADHHRGVLEAEAE